MGEPLDDHTTRLLYTELAEAEPSLGAQMELVVGPLAGWVTVVDVVGDPQFCKLLWYLAEPEVAILHAQTTHFELDMDGGGPYFSEEWVRGEKGVVRYHPAGSESIVPIAYLRTGGRDHRRSGGEPNWRTTFVSSGRYMTITRRASGGTSTRVV